MKRFARVLILCASLAVLTLVTYQLLPPSKAGRQAVEQLASVRTFSLGPVGYGGSIPVCEDEFFAVLASSHSSRLFRDLYERGTPEAKLYALCGLRLSGGGVSHTQFASLRRLKVLRRWLAASAAIAHHRRPSQPSSEAWLSDTCHCVERLSEPGFNMKRRTSQQVDNCTALT